MAPTYMTEIDRQRAYLDRLPDDYQFPLFNTKQALNSQRRNGYRNTAVAAREIIDNAIEAGADRIDVIINRISADQKKKNQRKDTVDAVAFLDNGSGMIPKMARFALSWGGGTHFDNPDKIGKFGFGLPNASINQTRRVSVYSKTEDSDEITLVVLDIDEMDEFGTQTVPEPTTGELPPFVRAYMKKNSLSFDHGTVIVWEQPDRLTYNQAGSLKPHMVDDFGAAYRNFLEDVKIFVDKSRVEMVDPLFLNSKSRYFLPPEKGGAKMMENVTIPVAMYRDNSGGGVRLKEVQDETELDSFSDGELMETGFLNIIISRLPYGFAVAKKSDCTSDDQYRRFQVRKSRRGMSFVRANREIETVDSFPRSDQDVASGLGRWPLLQGYAYHWAAEVRFSPELDEALGITNDKQNVRPIEDFWRVLTDYGIDKKLSAENTWQNKERKKKKQEMKAAAAEAEASSDKPTLGQTAAAAASAASGKTNSAPKRDRGKIADTENKKVEDEAEATGRDKEEVREFLEERARRRPYSVEFFDNEYAPFFEPEWGFGQQIVIRINRLHPFYSAVYSKLYPVPADGDTLVRHGIDLMLFVLAKSELETENEETQAMYKTQRTDHWSAFLRDALKFMENRESADDDVDEDIIEEDNLDDSDVAA